MKIAIVKYNAGNVQSVLYALQRLGIDAVVTGDAEEILKADKVIFPGVGHAGSAMEYLQKHHLDKLIISLKQPVLGICLGLQLMCNWSEEGNTKCLGIFNVNVKKFDNSILKNKRAHFKIPHMGWNNIYGLKSPLFGGVKENSFVYFVHSYYAEQSPETIATTDYIVPFSAAIHRDNFYGVQFHTEKSADTGIQIISNFLKLA
ncbi:imidazole glycerol phosphate synthase subunit HisH [Ginsengibacter hankyongi]|uniref:Imidazole glycerol phosphate synthase subunit HisH n=1 Tax=Ginsengibacter hankyongi TaxID=2607284 RepID=A0A5J5ILT8_9BACT|nr:imidazole glycerol phosphate synthase subunit HisH [Ginsengibacter hankyongi]KAA9040482.1 imidazole glycerol phosphate synthase subunit HisH [Ginsengibacter hankyongi]